MVKSEAQEFSDRLLKLSEQAQKTAAIIRDSAWRAGNAIDNAFYHAYLASGAKYGSDRAGYLRWLKDLAKKTESVNSAY